MKDDIQKVHDGKIHIGDYSSVFSEGFAYVFPQYLKFSDKRYGFLKLSPFGPAGDYTEIDDDRNITVKDDFLEKTDLKEGTRLVYRINRNALDIWNIDTYSRMLPQISKYMESFKGERKRIIESISIDTKSVD